MLASGTSCSDDNTNFDPIGDELGIPYKDGHDVYGVEVWEETSVILTNYYSLIEEIIQEKTAKIQSIWWLSPAKEKCNVRWNCSAPIMGKTDHSSSYIINPDYNMNSSQITIDLTDVTDNFTVEALGIYPYVDSKLSQLWQMRFDAMHFITPSGHHSCN